MGNFDMPSASGWLEALKKAKGFQTDAEVAAYLDVPKQTVSNWKRDAFQMGTLDSLNVAQGVGVNPLFVVICSAFNSTRDIGKKAQLLDHAAPLTPKAPPTTPADEQPTPRQSRQGEE